MLKERIKNYLHTTGIPMTKFCKRLGLCTATIYRYLKDDLRLSADTENRIKDYLEKFSF
ncbi:MAG: hypothetical protein J6D26_01010 [Clostridia bacterium]|nr:hypothetical protein [Clostridia bacterium]